MPACYTQRKFMPLIDRAFAENFSAQWIAACNSHDLKRIFALYSDDFVMCSPLIAERCFTASCSLRCVVIATRARRAIKWKVKDACLDEAGVAHPGQLGPHRLDC